MIALSLNDATILLAVLTLGLLSFALWPATVPRQVCFGAGVASMVGTIGLGLVFSGAAPSPAPQPLPLPTPIPTPAVGGLADLVPDQYEGQIGRFYADLGAIALVSQPPTTTDGLRQGYINAVGVLKAQLGIAGDLSQFRTQTKALMEQSLGLESKSLDPSIRNAFANTCQAIAAELGVGP